MSDDKTKPEDTSDYLRAINEYLDKCKKEIEQAENHGGIRQVSLEKSFERGKGGIERKVTIKRKANVI